jgi:hypothetical protein
MAAGTNSSSTNSLQQEMMAQRLPLIVFGLFAASFDTVPSAPRPASRSRNPTDSRFKLRAHPKNYFGTRDDL